MLELSLNVIIPPPAHCHTAGFGRRIENGLVRVAPDKIVSLDRHTDGQPWRFQYTPLHFVVGWYKNFISTVNE